MSAPATDAWEETRRRQAVAARLCAYSPDQERDESGRFGEGGSDGGSESGSVEHQRDREDEKDFVDAQIEEKALDTRHEEEENALVDRQIQELGVLDDRQDAAETAISKEETRVERERNKEDRADERGRKSEDKQTARARAAEDARVEQERAAEDAKHGPPDETTLGQRKEEDELQRLTREEEDAARAADRAEADEEQQRQREAADEANQKVNDARQELDRVEAEREAVEKRHAEESAELDRKQEAERAEFKQQWRQKSQEKKERRRQEDRAAKPSGRITMPVKAKLTDMLPTPDEDEEDFMDRCTLAGHSDSECELIWEQHGTSDKVKALTVRNRADDTSEVMLYGNIGGGGWFEDDGIMAKDFRAAVKAVKGKVLNLRVNCPGGSTIEASAMVQALDEWKGATKGRRVETDVDGIAASAASYLVCCGDVTRMAANALFMIHNPMGMSMGGADEMRRMADLLDKVKGQILDAYARKSKLPRDKLSEMMDQETWMTGSEAMANGFADSCGAPVQVAAFAGMDALLKRLHYKHAPQLPTDAAAWAATEARRQVVAKLGV